jgi:hypothetical protein
VGNTRFQERNRLGLSVLRIKAAVRERERTAALEAKLDHLSQNVTAYIVSCVHLSEHSVVAGVENDCFRMDTRGAFLIVHGQPTVKALNRRDSVEATGTWLGIRRVGSRE